jgi:tRNA threonylcarbamoyladenosine biosynthesis protein TsaE
MTKELHFNLDQITEIAQTILENVQSKTVLLYGEMGAGKTTLISAIVKEMGATDFASSPTFSLVNEYEITNDTIYHFDLYRIKNQYEALDMGIEDYLYSGSWNFIEWPEKIVNLLPEKVTVLELSLAEDGGRVLKLSENKTF